jgi:hypothetical protein
MQIAICLRRYIAKALPTQDPISQHDPEYPTAVHCLLHSEKHNRSVHDTSKATANQDIMIHQQLSESCDERFTVVGTVTGHIHCCQCRS